LKIKYQNLIKDERIEYARKLAKENQEHIDDNKEMMVLWSKNGLQRNKILMDQALHDRYGKEFERREKAHNDRECELQKRIHKLEEEMTA